MLKEGLKHTTEQRISQDNSALSMGSGDLNVLATPYMIALMENAAMEATKPFLTDKESTVGALINASHIRPTKIGDIVNATAELIKIEGKKLSFKISACDSKGIISEGTHIRYIINKKHFLEKL